MKQRHVSAFLSLLALIFSAAPALANPTWASIGINFGADEPPGVGSPVSGAAGVLGTVTWNNVTGANGAASDLIEDALGAPNPTAASVTWSSPNTWSSAGRGEENNTAPAGNDRNLMLGYIDTGNTAATAATVTVSNLPSEITDFGYDVYVYAHGGVNNGRYGDYTIGGVTQSTIPAAGVNIPFDGTYIEGSNYLVFENVNTPGFTLTALAGAPNFQGFRAPINAIEIVGHAIPEPGTFALAAMALAGWIGLRWRRR
jgi:hypothetical protein